LGRQHGFVLIGHCFGGLVIKSLVEEARKRALQNVRNAIDRKAKASAEMFLEKFERRCLLCSSPLRFGKFDILLQPLQSDHDSKEGCQAGWVHAKCPTTSIKDGKLVNNL
jgi:hypothetical protein